MTGYSAIVVAGGAGRRMAASGPKPAVPVSGVPMLVRVLTAVAAARPRVVVGPDTLIGLLPADVIVTLEAPPGGGPAAGAAAGLAAIGPAGPDVVVLLAADLPFLAEDDVTELVTAARAAGVDGAVAVDADGRDQWLCGAWSAGALRARLDQVGEPAGLSLRALLGGLRVRRVALAGRGAGRPAPTFDCDTVDDLRRAEEWSDDQSG
ncbi:molybdenum cofactor guanylyltransferase [Luedemannella helvata]|uniref:molybdenum cofactor guanylyltransferase n=1 Tax=Luedemannella helvata TaxID=349315 RepID=UPI0031D73F48